MDRKLNVRSYGGRSVGVVVQTSTTFCPGYTGTSKVNRSTLGQMGTRRRASRKERSTVRTTGCHWNPSYGLRLRGRMSLTMS